MDKAGERLKKIRLDKGISLDEVAKKTKVALNILRAIEDDSFINLEPIYIKGFIKIYCNFLGVAPSDFIAQLQEPQVTMKLSDEEEKATVFLHPLPVRRSFPWAKVGTVCAVIIALFLVVAVAQRVSKAMKQRAVSGEKPRVAAVKAARQQKKAVSAPKGASQAKQAQVKTAAAAAKDVQTGIRLGLHATEDCWVQVKVDGKTVFQSVLFRGRMESWTAQDRIDLWLGSAGGVELEVNGSRIPSLGRKGQVLKNIVINKDGLKVGK